MQYPHRISILRLRRAVGLIPISFHKLRELLLQRLSYHAGEQRNARVTDAQRDCRKFQNPKQAKSVRWVSYEIHGGLRM